MNIKKQRDKLGFVGFYLTGLVVLVVFFIAGFWFADSLERATIEENKALKRSLANLRQAHQEAVSQLNTTQVELEVSQLTNEQTNNELSRRIENEQSLKEKISFYQRVLAPETTQDGFVVQRTEVVPTASENNYLVKMILLQHEDIKAVIRGQLDIVVSGSQDGRVSSINLSELENYSESALEFAFKYFQVLEINLTLPTNFKPEALEISTDVYKYKRKRGSYSTKITWSEAFSLPE
ncbi:DUF6776 family protein [Glaciecola petra]|uniref:Uncharacterized protein n=1 Tax=Glaciecola petra TaxID=3075602 RepID=A0ABU2ZS86_9ALTE|nr:DUF6776 family protein [Aestuariibacter sp. P117]MDT0595498.1 hypothetical protein [Aestuariibacter sp. P117]